MTNNAVLGHIENMDLHTALMTIIAFSGFLALLFTGFNALLNAKLDPLKENQGRFEGRLDNLEAGQAKLEAGQAKLVKDIAEIKQMLTK